MKKLIEKIEDYMSKVDLKKYPELQTCFPFSNFDYQLAILFEENIIDFKEYLKLREEYKERNPFLYMYTFNTNLGEHIENRLLEKHFRIIKPNRTLDPEYDNQYDLFVDGYRVEVKSSKAMLDTHIAKRFGLITNPDRAIQYVDRKEMKFKMNFQQLKPTECDVFIWSAAFRDKLIYWVLNSYELVTNATFSPGQHRGNMGYEGQFHITNNNIDDFNEYIFAEEDIYEAIIKKGQENKSIDDIKEAFESRVNKN